MPGPSLLSTSTSESSAKPSASNAVSPAPQGYVAAKPNYDPFASFASPRSPSSLATPTPPPSLVQPQSLSQLSKVAQTPQPSSDPFAILSGPTQRASSPFSQLQDPKLRSSSPSASMFNFASSIQPADSSSPQSVTPQPSNGTSGDNDWNFTSALPDDNTTLPTSNTLIVSKTSVTIVFQVSRLSSNDPVIDVVAQFSNNTDSLITEYAFQVAAKVCVSLNNGRYRNNTLSLSNPGVHAPTHPSIRANPSAAATKRDHSAHPDSWRDQGASELGQDAMESVLYNRRGFTTRARRSSTARDRLMPVCRKNLLLACI